MSIISLGENTTPGAEQPTAEEPQASRLTALQIFAAAARTGEEELRRSPTGLNFCGAAAGLQMGLSGPGPPPPPPPPAPPPPPPPPPPPLLPPPAPTAPPLRRSH